MKEQKLFDLLLSLNPHPGIPFKNFIIQEKVNGKQYFKYCLYSCFNKTDEEDVYLSRKELNDSIRRINQDLTEQIYYDVVVLGISCPKDRPKCIICGKYVEFMSLKIRRLGDSPYRITCPGECSIKHRQNYMKTIAAKRPANYYNYTKTEEYRNKMSSVKKGIKFSKEHKDKLSLSLKKYKQTDRGKEHTKKLAEIRSINNVEKALSFTDNHRGNNGHITGIFNSKVFGNIYYDSSWELCFIEYVVDHYKKLKIKLFDRCKDVVFYETSDGTKHRYLPDFFIEFEDGAKLIIEIKPMRIVNNDDLVLRKKIAAIKYFHKKDIKYKILTEIELFNKKNISKRDLQVWKGFSLLDCLI